jgi:very-short-patch-repair endonuclease
MAALSVEFAEQFKPQEIANVLWAWAAAELPADHPALGPLLRRAVALHHELGDFDRSQLHQFLLYRRVMGMNNTSGSTHVDAEVLKLGATCRIAFEQQSRVVTVSAFQQDVARALTAAGAKVEEEVVLSNSGISVDMRVGGADSRVVVEVDGPTHFVRTRYGETEGKDAAGTLRTNGSTRLKHRLLSGLGWTVLHVPYYEWNALKNSSQLKAAYVAKLLESVARGTPGRKNGYY